MVFVGRTFRMAAAQRSLSRVVCLSVCLFRILAIRLLKEFALYLVLFAFLGEKLLFSLFFGIYLFYRTDVIHVVAQFWMLDSLESC